MAESQLVSVVSEPDNQHDRRPAAGHVGRAVVLDVLIPYRVECDADTNRIKLIYLANIEMGVETNAILAINSLDRYTTDQRLSLNNFTATWANNSFTLQFVAPDPDPPVVGLICLGHPGIPVGAKITAFDSVTGVITIDQQTTAAQAVADPVLWEVIQKVGFYNNSLERLFYDGKPYGNSFTIQSPGSLIYGYITKIVVSQVQIQYNVPTVNEDLNDTFYIDVAGSRFEINIDHGFYYPDELAAYLQTTIRAEDPVLFASLFVIFFPRNGFIFNNTASGNAISFPEPEVVRQAFNLSAGEVTNLYKTYRMLGITTDNDIPSLIQNSQDYPNFLYSPYIDIFSDVLTNYQKVKDTDTSVIRPKGLLARLYLSGVGNPQRTDSTSALGTTPFIMTADLNFPKVIRWTPDQTVTSVDIQLRDCYGDLLPGYENGYSTEFQMTLLCTEGDT